MKFSLHERRDQLAFFFGYASKGTERFLNEAMQALVDDGYQELTPESSFALCPFNDNLEQVLRSYHIAANGKKTAIAQILRSLVGEFVFLVSDFATPCCGDGRAFYCKSGSGPVCLECDRCGQIYDLSGSKIDFQSHKLMTKQDFLELLGEETAQSWPYHAKLRDLLALSSV